MDELRKDVESLAHQLAATLLMLNTLSVLAAATTEAAKSTAAAAAAVAAQNVAQASASAPAQDPVQARFASLNPLSAPAAAEVGLAQFNAAVAAAVAAIAAKATAQNAKNAQQNAQNADVAHDRAARSFAPLVPLSAPDAAEAQPKQAAAVAAADKNARGGRETEGVKSRLFPYASKEMLRKFQPKNTDPLLYSTDKKRLTPNCRALYG